MTGQQLKNSILQLAVQGKLVPQDPNDEPASVLLERIRAEKEQLIKEKKIKREKTPSFIFRGADNIPYEKVGDEVRSLEDEVPFEIPDSWEWVRLGSIGETNIGLTYRPTDVSTSGIAVLRSNNIKNGMMNYDDLIYVNCDVPDRALAHKGDILICARNGSRALVGKSAIIDSDGMAFGAFMAIYRSICNPYIQLFINSYLFRGQLDGANTTTINQVTQDMLKMQLCPLPPMEEQKRIVEKYKELEPIVSEYNNAYSKTQILNNSFPEALKKSILQQAVQGKLVPQNPDDEPANILLERIRAEKRRLIKEGKIKKDKTESVIFRRDNSHYEKRDSEEVCIDDEIPFEIPDSWQWCRLKELTNKIGAGSTPTGGKAVYTNSGIKFIRSQNVYNDGLRLDDVAYITPEINKQKSGSIVYAKDILLNITGGSIGRCAVVPDNFDLANVNQHVMIIRLVDTNIKEWIHAVLISEYIQNLIMDVQVGVSREGLSATKLMNFLIPMPPVQEQKRILNSFFFMENMLTTL